MNITLIIFIIIIMVKTRCVIANLVRVDKDEAVVGVEAACGERLLDRLARQLGRASHLVKMLVMIVATQGTWFIMTIPNMIIA